MKQFMMLAALCVSGLLVAYWILDDLRPFFGLAAMLVCAALLYGAFLTIRRAWRSREAAWLPDDLKRGRLVMVEKDLFLEYPYKIASRADRVYANGDGLFVPVEFKNRDGFQAFGTDIAQLSMQAWVLRQKGWPTAEYGYVVIRQRGSSRHTAKRVALKGSAYCEALIQRHFALKQGRVSPVKNSGPRCKSCGQFQKNCTG
jgi:CRISPR/Cas system-associated exonuclease Cas4 (RecB family)